MMAIQDGVSSRCKAGGLLLDGLTRSHVQLVKSRQEFRRKNISYFCQNKAIDKLLVLLLPLALAPGEGQVEKVKKVVAYTGGSVSPATRCPLT